MRINKEQASQYFFLIMAGILFFALYMHYKKQYALIDELKTLSASHIIKVEILKRDSEKLLSYRGSDFYTLNDEQKKRINLLLSDPLVGEPPGHTLPKLERIVRFTKNDTIIAQYTFLIFKRLSGNLYIEKENVIESEDGKIFSSNQVIVVVPGGASIFTKILEEVKAEEWEQEST